MTCGCDQQAESAKTAKTTPSFAASVEQSWYRPSYLTMLLLPLSVLFSWVTALRRWLFRRGWLSVTQLPVPVIVVGNISVGGTGKTPLTLWLCQYLQQQGLKPGILSRGYGVKLTKPTLVSPAMAASEVGDEPLLLAKLAQVPVVVWPARAAGGQFLLANTDCNVIICDDGLQHYALARDLEIILIDGQRGLGNGLLLPAGPLREGRSRLNTADLVLSNSAASDHTPYQLTISPQNPISLLAEQTPLMPPQPVTLVSGIGNPNRFVTTAQAAGYAITDTRFFPDHHPFTAKDLSDIQGPVLMTAKDAVKCQAFAQPNWYYLPITAQLPVAAEQIIQQKIQQIRSRYGL